MPRTNTGRIVYDRKPHLFRYRDVNRIARAVEPTTLDDLPDIILTIYRAYEDLAGLGAYAADLVAAGGLAPARPVAIVLVAMKVLLGMIAGLGESALKALRDAAGDVIEMIFRRILGGPEMPAGVEVLQAGISQRVEPKEE